MYIRSSRLTESLREYEIIRRIIRRVDLPDKSRKYFNQRIARLLGLKPDSRTLAKILELQELLKKGYSVGRALASVKLGWKSYYKYAPLNYSDPDISVPVPQLSGRFILQKVYQSLKPLLTL